MITLFSGTLWFGIGKTFLESTHARYPTDILFIEPQGDAHYSLTKDEPVVLQIFCHRSERNELRKFSG